jgi:putative ABC transport system permease protein
MNKKFYPPPKLARRILSSMKNYEKEFSITGDFCEEFMAIALQKGRTRAILWIWGQIIAAIPFYLKSVIFFGGIMFGNHLKIAIRNFKRARLFALINTGGLAIGLACCILVFFYVSYELSYDRYHKNAENIYRVIRDEPENLPRGGTTMENTCPSALAEALKDSFSEVQRAARIRRENVFLQFEDTFIPENKFFCADREILEIFDFPLVSGDTDTALKEPFSLVVTQNAAKKYFGNENPVGKSVKCLFEFLGSRMEQVLTITGVLEDVPKNSHFTFDFLASSQTLLSMHKEKLFGWGDGISFKTYVLLNGSADLKDLEGKFTEILQKNSPPPYDNNKLYLQPLISIHLGGNIQNEIEANSTMGNIYIFSAVAFLIMIIASFNYMNLSTARSLSRSLEVGIRKVVGAERKNLIGQFIGEAFLFSMVAVMIAIVCVILFLPEFNSLIDRNIDFRSLDPGVLFLGIAILTAIVSILSGSYPALFLSSFDPVKVLKRSHLTGSKKVLGFRNLLVTLQFAISITLIMATLLVTNQLHFIQEKNLGFAKEHVLCLQGSGALTEHYDAFKADVIKNPNIRSATLSSGTPASTGSVGGVDWEGEKPGDNILWYNFCVDYDFLETLGLEMSEGRFFSREFATDVTNYVLNEAAVKTLSWKLPIGKSFSVWRRPGEVIGIVKDFHFRSLHDKIQPLVLRFEPVHKYLYDVILIRLSSENISPTISFIEKTFREFDPRSPFVYSFLDEEIDKFYRKEQKFVQTFNYFSFLAVLIACLGVFGMLSFSIEQKTKEIGIRKVLGAKVSGIVKLLSKELLKCVLLANIIAWPAAYWIMRSWLRSYAYRVNLGLSLFILSSAMILAIALLTVSYKALKAACANPVDSLRYE